MLETIYQKLIILGFTENFIVVSLLVISFFIILIIIQPAIHLLIKYRCDMLIAYFLSLLIIFLIAKEQVERYFDFTNDSYIYFFSLVTGLLTIRLTLKKISEKINVK